MNARALWVLLGCLITGSALADACQVTSRSSSAAVQPVELESCFEYQGMPADALDWSCRNESKQMVNTTQHKLPKCAAGYFASCTAALTQETLANPRATRNDPSAGAIAIPDDARIVTYYYAATDRTQLQKDCEQGGGQWREEAR
ncbi:hypothetical protein JQX08_14510 [Pseudomonas sp. UL073]|uniref:Lipoprotein n=1 Tax=Zestomonas insulae TaxID=2809017 RepID=A0ABS2IGP0_9GAMM|nr:hypothetical protein [Pseudomonas insulae]MBM7061920.1 hypothetical protein [Pseudomonas insulae]